MKNKSEKKTTYQVDGWRYVREETSFTVDAVDIDEAQELAQDIADDGICEWNIDVDAIPLDETVEVMEPK